MTSLLQEIISVYPLLNPSQLTAAASNRVCNALALLQCVASHNETRSLFLSGASFSALSCYLYALLTRPPAHIPLFLYPFLNTTSKSRPFEYLRLTSLGVIGALVKNDSSDVINFLLTTEIIPLCLRIMETGSELSKTVAIFIVQKILLDDMGLNYICQTYERFYAVGSVLSNMVTALVDQQTVRLLKHVVRCFLRYVEPADRTRAPSLTNPAASATTLAPAKPSASACPSRCATPPSAPSSATTPPRSAAWPSCSSTSATTSSIRSSRRPTRASSRASDRRAAPRLTNVLDFYDGDTPALGQPSRPAWNEGRARVRLDGGEARGARLPRAAATLDPHLARRGWARDRAARARVKQLPRDGGRIFGAFGRGQCRHDGMGPAGRGRGEKSCSAYTMYYTGARCRRFR